MNYNFNICLSKPHYSGFENKFLLDDLSNIDLNFHGKNVLGFENDLESFLGLNTFVTALNSGTSAIHLALILLNVKCGDEVICQTMTFSASVNPIVYQGAIPIFVDSELDTWNLCPIELEKAIKDRIKKGKKPKAIIIVHLFGMPCKFNEIKAISIKYDIPILEDSAEALGSSYKGQLCGTLGDLSVLSFNGNKIITTCGGGALISNDALVKDKAIFLSTQAKDNAPHYQHSHIGYNYRMDNISAAIGRGQMVSLDLYISLRRATNKFYIDLFSNIDHGTVFVEYSRDFISNHWLSAVLMSSYEERESLRLTLLSNGIESRPIWKPMHLQPIFEKYPYYGNKISETLFEKGLCLPSGSDLSYNNKCFITNVVNAFYKIY